MNGERCLLLVWLDALRSSYINEYDTPFLYELSQEGLFGAYRPSMAYVGIGISMFTGVSASTHGAWTEFKYAPQESPFRWTTGVSPLLRLSDFLTQHTGQVGRLARAGLNKTIFVFSNKHSGRSYIPIGKQVPSSRLRYFDVSVKHNEIAHMNASSFPTLFDILRSQLVAFRSLEESTFGDAAIFRKALDLDQRARVVFLQFSELDKVGHEFGPDSVEIRTALHRIDARVRQLFKTYQSRFELELFVLSDHGMVEVKNYIDVQGALLRHGLREGRDFVAFYDSTLARFWPLEARLETIESCVKSVEGGEVLGVDQMKRFGVPNDRSYGDLIWLANPGSIILPNYYQGSRQLKGMHGYDPDCKGLEGAYLICSKNAPHGREGRVAKPVDILPTILSLLGLKIPEYVEGTTLF